MTSSRISYHVHATFTPDRDRLKEHIATIRPHFLLVSGDPVSVAKELSEASPETNMIWREGGDRFAYQQKTPDAWLTERSGQAPGMFLYTSDETPLDSEAIDWHVKLMELAAERGVKLCVMNLAAGTPNADDWNKLRPVIDLLNANRDLFVMGLREFAGGVITSGVGGGDPTMIQPDSWPADVADTELYHMGRYRNLMHYCADEGIQTPRLVITHHGFERLNDIGDWLDSLHMSPDLSGSIRGWRTLNYQWMTEAWFGDLYESAEEAYLEQLKWANNVLYEPFGAVEAQMIYSWGMAGQEEVSLDISQAFEFQKKLENYAATQPDYAGFAGSVDNAAVEALSDEAKGAIVAGFQAALDAGILDGTTEAALRRWLGILEG